MLSPDHPLHPNIILWPLKLYWIRMLLRELGVTLSTPATLYCDNISAIALASNLVFYARTKHVEVDYHFVCEKVVNKDIQVCHIATQDQLVDIFTKGQTTNRFKVLWSKLMVILLPINLQGGGRRGVILTNSGMS